MKRLNAKQILVLPIGKYPDGDYFIFQLTNLEEVNGVYAIPSIRKQGKWV